MTIPIVGSETSGRWMAAGIVRGSNKKIAPPKVKNPSHSVTVQKATTWVICRADNPQAEYSRYRTEAPAIMDIPILLLKA